MSTEQTNNTNNETKERNIFMEKDHRGRDVWVVSKRWEGDRIRKRVGRGRKPPAIAYSILAELNTAAWQGAEAWHAVKQKYAKKGKLDKPVHHTVTSFVALYNEKYVPTLRSTFTSEALKPIVRLVGNRSLKEFTRKDAEDYRDLRAKEVEKSTVNKELWVLSGLFSYALANGFITQHPIRTPARQKDTLRFKLEQPVPQVMRPDEVRLIIEKTLEVDYVVGAYLAVLAATGLRKTEGLKLKRHFFHSHDRELVIEASKNGKPRKTPIPLSEYAIQLVSQLPVVFGNPHVFVSPETLEQLTSSQVNNAFEKGRKAAGIEWPRLHDFRRYRATQWLRDGVNPDMIKVWLGHSSLKITEGYLIYSHAVGTEQARRAEAAEERQIAHNRAHSSGQEAGNREMAVSISTN